MRHALPQDLSPNLRLLVEDRLQVMLFMVVLVTEDEGEQGGDILGETEEGDDDIE